MTPSLPSSEGMIDDRWSDALPSSEGMIDHRWSDALPSSEGMIDDRWSDALPSSEGMIDNRWSDALRLTRTQFHCIFNLRKASTHYLENIGPPTENFVILKILL